MSVNSQQWAALDSEHERLVDVSRSTLRADTSASRRAPWHRRIAAAVTAAPQASAATQRPARHRAARPES